jgi:hypothetical protein
MTPVPTFPARDDWYSTKRLLFVVKFKSQRELSCKAINQLRNAYFYLAHLQIFRFVKVL